MNAAAQKSKKETEKTNFSTSESFGLFMEGLRSLKKFTEESEKKQPDHTVLEQRLDQALDCLSKCELNYGEDSLPLYSLGLALTMKNQSLYAEMLIKHGKESPRLTRSAPHRALEPIELTTGQTRSTPDAGDVRKTLSRHKKKGTLAGVYYVATEYLGPPPYRPWPHLSHAADIFEKIWKTGPSELHTAAAYNLAHVYSKREGLKDLVRAELLLRGINWPPLQSTVEEQKEQGVFSKLRKALEWALLALFHKKAGDQSAEQPARQERLMTWLQSQTLLASVIARKDLKAIAREKKEFYATSATIALSAAKKSIDETKDLSKVKKTDLEADYWTKAGFLAYNQAFALSPDDMEFDAYLSEAESFLRRALELKENWSPAQIYLAQVLQAQGRISEAQECLEAVVGKPPAPPAPTQVSPPAGQTGVQTQNPPAPEAERQV